MAYRVELTARSIRNLRNIYNRIHADNSVHACDWFEGLEQAIFSLDENPLRCPGARDDPSLRQLLYGSGRDVYRVLFEVDESHSIVRVLHIRHGSREPLKRGDVAH